MSKRTLPRGAARRTLVPFLPLGSLGIMAAFVTVGSASCVTPQQDYDDYVARAADAQGPPSSTGTVDSGPIDSANLHPPDSSFADKKYLMACISQISPEADKALLWVATMSFVPSAGGGGKLTYTNAALAATATDVNSPVTRPLPMLSANISAKDGTGTINVGTDMLPASANGITNTPVNIENAVVDIRIEADKTACANLGGTITGQATVPLNPVLNPCIFLPTDSSGRWTPFQTSDFHCP